MKYYVIVVKTSKKDQPKLVLVEAENEAMVNQGFDTVKMKFPFLKKEDAFIDEIYDTTIASEFRDLVSFYLNDSICFKIRFSEINTYYLSDTYVRIDSLQFHDLPVSTIHIQSKRLILKDSEAQRKFDIINEKIRSLLMTMDINFSVFETTMLWEWDDITSDMWETVLAKNDVAIVFHNTNIDTIIGLAKILYKLIENRKRFLYFFFVDVDNNLYKVKLDDTMEIIPVENGRYIV